MPDLLINEQKVKQFLGFLVLNDVSLCCAFNRSIICYTFVIVPVQA